MQEYVAVDYYVCIHEAKSQIRFLPRPQDRCNMKVQELPIKGYPFFIIAEDTANSDNRVCIIVDRPTNTAYWSPVPKNFSIKSRWTEFDFKELPGGALGNVHIPEINQAQSLTFKEFLKDIGY